MRVLIAAGGTGGHIYPGIAVAKEIMRRDTESEVKFVGTAHGLETRLVPAEGFDLLLIESAGLKNVGVGARLHGLSLLPRSLRKAHRLIREFGPHVAVGAGGYVSGPVLLTAALMNVPTLVMESNALPGWTNRVLSHFVDRAALSFEEALPYFRGKGIITGNPVRREFFDIPRRDHRGEQLSLLVFGGSQGAHAINQAMVEALPSMEGLRHALNITHQTGERDFDRVQTGYSRAGWIENVAVRQYIDNMVEAFAKADLVICRAGATTSAELVAARKGAIMIPFPLAADDHQRRNAEALSRAGVARMILQQELNGKRLAAEICGIFSEPGALEHMEDACNLLARIDSASKAVDIIEELGMHSLN